MKIPSPREFFEMLYDREKHEEWKRGLGELSDVLEVHRKLRRMTPTKTVPRSYLREYSDFVQWLRTPRTYKEVALKISSAKEDDREKLMRVVRGLCEWSKDSIVVNDIKYADAYAKVLD